MKPFIAFLLVLLVSCSTKQDQHQPDAKQTGIPDSAFFVSGNNNGYWCLADINDHRNGAKITVYDAANGKLLLSRRFSLICRLKGDPIWLEDLKEQVDYFDGKTFHLKQVPGKDSCWLQ